jgi:hypothetical protein
MKKFKLIVHHVCPKNGPQRHDDTFTVKARGHDDAKRKVRELLESKGFHPVRSMSFGPDDTIIVYCAEVPNKAEAVAGISFKRPHGRPRI